MSETSSWILEVTDLKKSYPSPEAGLQTVLDVRRFEMQGGGQVALRGVSGSGKTTFLHCISGILKPDLGSVRVAGTAIFDLSESERDRLRAGSLGYIFQTFNLLQGHTALENVLLGMAFGAGERREHAIELLRRVGLADRMQHLPRQLSTGQQQRVAVARALAGKPKLVLADEPTGNLDAERAAEAMDLIRAICEEQGASLLLVSHDPQMLSRFSTVIDFAEINLAASSHRRVP